MNLEELRKKAAEKKFASIELEDLEDFERGWTRDDVYWSKKIYWRDDYEDTSRVGSFGVEFEPGTAEIIDWWTN